MKPVVLFGAGGLAREYAAIARSLGRHVLGFVDVEEGPSVLCAERDVAARLQRIVEARTASASYDVLLAVGAPRVLAKLDAVVRSLPGASLVCMVHSSAVCLERVELGEGTVVYPRATLTTDVVVGRACCVSNGVNIGHDARVGDFCVLTPGVCIAGRVTLGDRVFMGTGAVVLPGVRIGDDAVIGAGAVVTKDVDAGATVVGVPARARV